MKFVEPIRDKKKISQIKNMLKAEKRGRDLLLFVLGINTALRVSDLLKLKVKDVFNEKGEVLEFFEIQERKTKKRNKVTINDSIREALEFYKECEEGIVQMPENYLFFQKKAPQKGKEAIKRIMAWKLIQSFAEGVGLQGKYGTHTLRKTWGYQARKVGVDMGMIQHKLNHSSLAVTKKYLGITDDEMEEVCKNLNL